MIQLTESMEPRDLSLFEFLEFMSDISEDWWCARWMNGLEFSLWTALNNPNKDHYIKLTLDEKRQLNYCVEKYKGWWVFIDDIGNAFLPMNEWLEYYNGETNE